MGLVDWVKNTYLYHNLEVGKYTRRRTSSSEKNRQDLQHIRNYLKSEMSGMYESSKNAGSNRESKAKSNKEKLSDVEVIKRYIDAETYPDAWGSPTKNVRENRRGATKSSSFSIPNSQSQQRSYSYNDGFEPVAFNTQAPPPIPRRGQSFSYGNTKPAKDTFFEDEFAAFCAQTSSSNANSSDIVFVKRESKPQNPFSLE